MPPEGSRRTTEQPEKKGRSGGAGSKSPAPYSQNGGGYLPDVHRVLPHSVDAEQGILGSMLLSPREVIGDCVEKISKDHFHIPAHATIYEVLVEFWNNQTPLDFITLTQTLKDRSLLDQVGGPAFITHLFTFVPTAANAAYYLDIVREKFILRQIIRSCTECVGRAYDDQSDVQGLLDEVEQKVFSITENRFKGQLPELKTMVLEAIEKLVELHDRRGGITGISTGFSELDKMTDGLHPAEMFIIAARPSMGKTAFAMNIAEHVALELNKAVAIFSLEMSSQQLVQRLLCSRAKVNHQRVRDGFLTERDFQMLTDVASKLAESKIYIDDTPGLSILELRAKARRFKSQHNIELIVIDYLQLLKSTSRRAQDNRQLEIAEISSGLKALSKELSIPIIVLAQLNRQPEQRAGGKPRLSDLRESGSIEQDADVVTLLVRSAYYEEDEEGRQEKAGEAELIIAKQRNGPVGEVPLTFLKEYTRFEDRARPAAEPN